MINLHTDLSWGKLRTVITNVICTFQLVFTGLGIPKHVAGFIFYLLHSFYSYYILIIILYFVCGPGSSVGIATELRAGRSGDRIPRLDEIFRPSRPALGPTQPPVKWVTGLSRGYRQPGRAADHTPPSSAAVMEE